MKKKYNITGIFFFTSTTAVITVILLKFFVWGIFYVPTFSMSPTILGGDCILINKMIYGPRFISTISSEKKTIKIQRIKGYSFPRKNDVIVFNPPYQQDISYVEIDKSKFFIKRCLGTPGDTLAIINARYVINNKRNYGDTSAQIKLWRTRFALPIEKYTLPYPDSLSPWSLLNYGPIIIPGKGIKITLTPKNRFFYQKLINYENPGKVPLSENQYTFKKNWYFMAGDNLEHSYDSRYWGVVPEDCIIGKAILILYARNIFSRKWEPERFLKTIR